MKLIDITGVRFGRLTVLKRSEKKVASGSSWDCLCDCGNQVTASKSNLKAGHCTSCGCFRIETGRARARKEKGHSGKTYWYESYKRGAKARHKEFSLTREQFIEVTSMNCRYCGAPPDKKVYNHYGLAHSSEFIEHSSYVCNGVDRVDNNLGYILGNVVPCCSRCNRAKGTMTAQDFVAMAQAVSSFTKGHPLDFCSYQGIQESQEADGCSTDPRST